MKISLNKYALQLVRTIGTYVVLFILFFILQIMSPSSPCNPGLGELFLILVVPITVIILLFNSVFKIKSKKEYFIPFTIHLLIVLLFVIVYATN